MLPLASKDTRIRDMWGDWDREARLPTLCCHASRGGLSSWSSPLYHYPRQDGPILLPSSILQMLTQRYALRKNSGKKEARLHRRYIESPAPFNRSFTSEKIIFTETSITFNLLIQSFPSMAVSLSMWMERKDRKLLHLHISFVLSAIQFTTSGRNEPA